MAHRKKRRAKIRHHGPVRVKYAKLRKAAARRAAKLAYLNLGSALKAAAARGDVKEIERLTARLNHAWLKMR